MRRVQRRVSDYLGTTRRAPLCIWRANPFTLRSELNSLRRSSSCQRLPTMKRLACVLLCGVMSVPSLAVAEPPQQPGRSQPAAGDRGGAPQIPAERKRRAAELATYLVILLAITGTLLVVVTVLWGFRVRRVVRKGLPRVAPVDELWYLRAKEKPAAGRPGGSSGPSPPPETQDEADQ